jgi:ribosomal protein L5
MSLLEYFFFKNLKYSLVNKFKHSSLKNLPKPTKVTLTFKTKVPNLKIIATSFLALEFLSKKTNKNSFIIAKQQNLVLRIKKGDPIGCRIFISKIKMLRFIEQLIFNVLLPKKNNSVDNFHKPLPDDNSCSFVIRNSTAFPQLRKFHNIFNITDHLNLVVNLATKDKKVTTFIFKSFLIY